MKSKSSFTMNIKRSGHYFLIVLTIATSLWSCKKDKTDDPAPPPPVEVVAITVQELKALVKDESITVPDGRKISGIVISNADGKNIAPTSVILQEGTDKPGIIVNLTASHSFKTGDKIEINVSKQKLERVNGEITLTGIPLANVTKSGTESLNARATTVEELNTNAVAWDGTLVSLGEGRFYGGSGKYTTEGIEYEDTKGRVKIGVASTAAFKDQNYAASVSKLIGIVRVEGTKARIDIRTTGDVTSGEITKILTETFTDVSQVGNPNTYNPDVINAFTTDFGEWSNSHAFYLSGNRFDGDFLSATRKYWYIVTTAKDGANGFMPPASTINFSSPNLKGLRKVAITLAGSKMAGQGILNGTSEADEKLTVQPFNVTTDYFQLGMWGQVSQFGGFWLESAKITKVGELTTVTFNIPSKEDMLKLGSVTPEDVDNFLANPYIMFYNISTRAADAERETKAPIIIEKVEFSLAN